MRVFLGGPIQSLTGDPVLLKSTKTAVERVIEQFNDSGFEVLSAHVVEQFGSKTHEWTPLSVTKRDINWMRECDIFIALLPSNADGGLARTDGTHIELGWASALGKPIVLVIDQRVEDETSHLVKGLSSIAQVARVDFASLHDDPVCLVKATCELYGAMFKDTVA